LAGCILATICVAGLLGFFGVLAGYWVIRAHVTARLEKDLPVYIALMPALPPEGGVEQVPRPQPGGIAGKVRGKMVVVNVNERRIDALHFALPRDLWASKPEEVATVVLLTWEQRRTSNEPFSLPLYGNRYIMVGQVKVFDWESKSEITSRTFLGDLPAFSEGQPATGPKPDDQVLSFLTGLRRP
jgi:hypothetical protein